MDKGKKDFSKEDIDEIEDILKRVINSYEKSKKNSPKRQINAINLNSHIEEYLNSYIIIGYDINDNYVQISNLNTQGEIDKIQTALHRVMKYGPGVNTDISEYVDDEESEEDSDDYQE